MFTHSTTEQHAEIIALAHDIRPTMPGAAWCDVCQEAERLQAELAQYAAGWDAYADELPMLAYAPCLCDAQPEPPTLITPQARKAAYNAAQGVKPVPSNNGYLVPSATRNVVHFVAADGRCTCEAGQSGKACWHVALVALDQAA